MPTQNENNLKIKFTGKKQTIETIYFQTTGFWLLKSVYNILIKA